MPSVTDPFQDITHVPENVLNSLAELSDAAQADSEKTGRRRKFLAPALDGLLGGSDAGAVVLDVGCGTGALVRHIAKMPGVRKVIGIDPSPYFLDLARQGVAEDSLQNVEFIEGTSTDLPLSDMSVDLVTCVHLLNHVPTRHHAKTLAEVRRVLKEGGKTMLQDCDYASWSVTRGPTDVLSAPVEVLINAWSEGRYLCRQFPKMLEDAGFVPQKLMVHSTVDDSEDSFGFKYVLMRALRLYRAAGYCSEQLATALAEEAQRRVLTKEFQCVRAYGACVGYKPATRQLAVDSWTTEEESQWSNDRTST
mmetsp:Transcript_54428/g.100574  ORF Transcript_54428/g.100574 Transcript_54428/m.100574 type:complete len:307 (-) Transcript_54428:224-1144(-)